MNNLSANLSSIMLELIRKQGLSLTELARRIKIPQPTLYRIAHGEHQRPHKKTLETLSNFFDVTIDQLLGLEPIKPSIAANPILKLPILNCGQIANWPHTDTSNAEYLIFERPISTNAFAVKMPDKSMEPLITKDALLIIDPEKKPEYRSLVAVKLHNVNEIVIRQLIIDAANCYIRPLNQDLSHFEMTMLKTEDRIIGTIVEARLSCEGL